MVALIRSPILLGLKSNLFSLLRVFSWTLVCWLFSASEVLSDATLTVSYSFDGNLLDSGTLAINGSGTSFSYSTIARSNQSLALLLNPSFVQAIGLVLLGTSGQAYSFAIWIRPLVVSSGTIVHVSGSPSGLNWCIPMLGFTSSSAIGVQGWNAGPVTLTGPAAVANVWTHLAVTYSSSNGLRLYVNGTQSGASSATYSYTAAGFPVTLTLGQSRSGTGTCSTGNIVMGQYLGYMDQFQLYSRELTASFVSSLVR